VAASRAFEQEESERAGASAKPAPRGSHLLLRKKNQSISLTRTIARRRAQKDESTKDEGTKEESEGVRHTAYPFR
jgi:hypothetical protein